jgi:uncharacterized protein
VSRLYLDTCCIIYLIEASSPFHGVVAARLRLHNADPTATLVTSRLSRLECRTKPLRMNDTSLLADYERFFAARRLVVAELSAWSSSARRSYGPATASRRRTRSTSPQPWSSARARS